MWEGAIAPTPTTPTLINSASSRRARACRSAGGDRPAHLLRDLLARRAQRVALRVAARHPHLPAERPDRSSHHEPLGNGRPRRDELPFFGVDTLEHDVGHTLVVTVDVGDRRSHRCLRSTRCYKVWHHAHEPTLI